MIKVNDLLKYRYVWMGLAILFILFFHSELVFHNVVISIIQDLGYGGVDIFMFASGIGCYCSLSKKPDIAAFMKRRFIKIMPMYLCFIIVWLLYKRVFFEMPISSMIGNLFSVQNFTGKGNEFNWYVSAMWLMYLLAPFFASVIGKMKSWKSCVAAMVVLVLFTVSFWYSYTYIITIARIPIFFLGMLVGRAAMDGFVIRNIQAWGMFFLSVAGVTVLLVLNGRLSADRMWLLGGLWYPFLLIVPGLCLAISILCSKLDASKVGRGLLTGITAIGKRTFSIYLVHIFVFDVFKNIMVAKGICPDHNGYRLLLVIPIAVGCVLLEILSKGIRKTCHL